MALNYFKILDVFGIISGLQYNYKKSSVITWSKTDDVWATDNSNMTRCKKVKCLLIYQGLPLSENMNKVKAWDQLYTTKSKATLKGRKIDSNKNLSLKAKVNPYIS